MEPSIPFFGQLFTLQTLVLWVPHLIFLAQKLPTFIFCLCRRNICRMRLIQELIVLVSSHIGLIICPFTESDGKFLTFEISQLRHKLL